MELRHLVKTKHMSYMHEFCPLDGAAETAWWWLTAKSQPSAHEVFRANKSKGRNSPAYAREFL